MVSSQQSALLFKSVWFCFLNTGLKYPLRRFRLLLVVFSLCSVFPLLAVPQPVWGTTQSFLKVMGL